MAIERKDVDAKYKWDLSAIYKDSADFEKDFSTVEDMARDYAKHEKTMTCSAKELFCALSELCRCEEKINKLWCYAYLSFTTDTSNNASQAMVSRVRSLAVRMDSASWFVSPYLMRLDKNVVDSWYDECQELNSYRRMIDKELARKPYTMSDDCEKMMANLGDCFGSHGNVRGIFANSDLQFGTIKDENGKKIRLDNSNYISMLTKQDRRVRRCAFKCLYKTYEQFKNTFGTLYSSYVKERCSMASVRGYKSSLAASTFHDEVTPEIYDSLIKSVRASMPPMYDYYELKRELLGVERLHLYDVYTPLISSCDKSYTYEEAVEEVLKTVKVFGTEYYEALKAGLTERGWVDVYPTKNKQSGAFSAGCSSTEPYIMLNYNGRLNDVSTLAHEAGHSMHSYFSRKYNEPHASHYTIFVAEVASTVNELLLSHRQLAECDDIDRKLFILNELMETYKATLYRQTMFAEFEKWAHAEVEKGHPLTADNMSEHYKKLVRAYFGPKVAIDREIAYEWMRIPHFYTNFYVYKYATCISAASAIVKRIETEGEAYVSKYIDFLKCGDSKSPLESLLVAGIDMTDPAVINGAIEDFSSAISEFRRLYKEKQEKNV